MTWLQFVISSSPNIEQTITTLLLALICINYDCTLKVFCIGKYNFQSAPHILEPIHLLTIEAYQSRMKTPAKMNYYTSVAPKCAYRFNGPDSTNNSAQFIAECCHFHGCQGREIDLKKPLRFAFLLLHYVLHRTLSNIYKYFTEVAIFACYIIMPDHAPRNNQQGMTSQLPQTFATPSMETKLGGWMERVSELA